MKDSKLGALLSKSKKEMNKLTIGHSTLHSAYEETRAGMVPSNNFVAVLKVQTRQVSQLETNKQKKGFFFFFIFYNAKLGISVGGSPIHATVQEILSQCTYNGNKEVG